jgi:hypothetical protein
MAALALTDDRAGRQVERGKKRSGAMANIFVSHAIDITQAHGQQGLGAFQSLNLTFFIDAQHHCFIRRMQIQAHHIPHLFNKKRIV